MFCCLYPEITDNSRRFIPGFCLLPGALLEVEGGARQRRQLLCMLAGLEYPAEGSVHWEEYPVSPSLLINGECVHFLGKEAKASGWRTVEGYLRYWARRYHAEERVEAALHYMGLDAVRRRRCFRLPAEEKRRVALARLLAVPARIWLLEEPLFGLDATDRERVQALITSRCNQGGIVVFGSEEAVEISGIVELNIQDFSL